MNMKKVYDYIESMRQDMVNTLGELIAFQSFRQNPSEGAPFGGPARECLDRALEICKGFGFITENKDGYVGRAAISTQESALGILAHLDVVPAGDGWSFEPYKATVSDGKVFGRGAMDDKGPAVSVIYAMKALHDLKVPLKSGVELLLGTDEECGSSDLKYYTEHAKMPKQLFTPDANYPLINIEKGHIGARFSASAKSDILLELHGGRTINAVPASAAAVLKNVSEAQILLAEKNAECTVKFDVTREGDALKVTAEGVSAHASTPDMGDNALTGLIKLLSNIGNSDPAIELLRGLAREFPYKETDGKAAGVKSCDDISGALTLVLSILDYEQGAFSGGIDIRFPVCDSVKKVSEKLGAALKRAGFESEINGAEPHCVPSDSPFIKELLGAYEAVTGKKGEPMAIGGGTYVHGITGGVAFGCEIEGEDNRIHGADEFIRIDALVENAKIFAEAIVRVCGVESL